MINNSRVLEAVGGIVSIGKSQLFRGISVCVCLTI